ncbi:MAG: transporter substrate-binding domain-containing protein [Deltaproteobacteria bacterium]|jgi:ABC-type amino acid transport substrate-binding protein|nr:transporter substrate-binding domain-containing protein [Deltaproteobacteria bacterium]
MKNFLLVWLFFILMTPVLAQAQGETLKVGTDCDYTPYSSRDSDGKLVGFEIDLVNEIGSRLGRAVEFHCTPFDSAIPSLTTHMYDALFDTLSITEERKKQVDFTIAYRANTGRFGTTKDFEAEIFTPDGQPNPKALAGKVIGLQGATVYQDYIASRFPGVEVRLYDKLPNLYEDLNTGRVDLVIASTSNVWSGLINKDPEKFKFIGPDIEDQAFGEGVGAAVRLGDPLLADLNKALQSIIDDGTFKTLNQKYFPFTLLPSVWK